MGQRTDPERRPKGVKGRTMDPSLRFISPSTPRIGFYICHCGVNIAFRVRVEEVAEWARGLKNVVVSRDYRFMCSDPGQEMIELDIAGFGLNRVVVASCSPRLHEKTFQAACRRAGINPYFFQMASVREQVSWVTEDPDAATRKAKTLAAAAIRRVNRHLPLETREVPVHPDTLIVGGGIAGMQAALDIASGGKKVYLVERETTIGGHMLQFDKTFPTLDCAACIGTPKMVEVGQNEKIELLTYSEVESISGYIGNYTVRVRKNPRYVDEDVCTGCGECARVCPVTRPSEWDVGLGDRKAIYRSFPQAVPITFCIDKKDRAPCVAACPAHANVQGYVQMIREGKYEQAVRVIMERIPLPGVLGRVCPHPCEDWCRRAEVDDPVAIRELKRFAADRVDFETLPLPEIREIDRKVAVIGSGPAGLTVAYDLRRSGYGVTIFEALGQLGGMLRYGIPDYRLPPDVLDREIGYILRMGVTAETGAVFGRDFTAQTLAADGYDAVFIGTGAHGPSPLGIPGETGTPGVIDAVAFLRRVNDGIRMTPGKTVTVIGGGNVAIDAARTALRIGARNVTVVYRRTRAEMPAFEDETREAEEEGIRFAYLAAPVRILTDGRGVSGLECARTRLGPPDADGRRRPETVPGSAFFISCDAVIPAVGQRIVPAWEAAGCRIESGRGGRIRVNPQTLQTCLPHVFAGGDAVSGPATVVEAVAAGHRAAAGIIGYLENRPVPGGIDIDSASPETPGDWAEIPPDTPARPRETPSHIAPTDRTAGFGEVSAGLVEPAALREAERCLNCGICCECMECVRVCEARAIDHTMRPEEIEFPVGSIIVATGYDVFDPTPMTPYGYGRYPNVFTSLEFERLSNATGPTGGKLLLRDASGAFTRPPDSVALLHCVGSRDDRFHEYCSRVCCMYAMKYAHLVKEKVGHHARVYDFYIDLRCFGKGYEQFHRRCQEEGTLFIRGKVAEITDRAESPEEAGKLIAIGEDTLLGRRVRVPVDMVVLCVAMEARADTAEVGRIFGISQGADGFFMEAHPKLGPLETTTDGVFLAGACQSPKDIPDTVAQASGAAAKSLALSSRGMVVIPSTVSAIDPDICIGCKVCIDLCPYGAISFDARRGVSVVNDALCKGCGSCSGYCPSGAARVHHFRKKQVMAEFDGLMDAVAEVRM